MRGERMVVEVEEIRRYSHAISTRTVFTRLYNKTDTCVYTFVCEKERQKRRRGSRPSRFFLARVASRKNNVGDAQSFWWHGAKPMRARNLLVTSENADEEGSRNNVVGRE